VHPYALARRSFGDGVKSVKKNVYAPNLKAYLQAKLLAAQLKNLRRPQPHALDGQAVKVVDSTLNNLVGGMLSKRTQNDLAVADSILVSLLPELLRSYSELGPNIVYLTPLHIVHSIVDLNTCDALDELNLQSIYVRHADTLIKLAANMLEGKLAVSRQQRTVASKSRPSRSDGFSDIAGATEFLTAKRNRDSSASGRSQAIASCAKKYGISAQYARALAIKIGWKGRKKIKNETVAG
jgi:hypothetical protein